MTEFLIAVGIFSLFGLAAGLIIGAIWLFTGYLPSIQNTALEAEALARDVHKRYDLLSARITALEGQKGETE